MAKILVVEDEKMLGNVICQHLKARYHIVDRVMDGESALEYLLNSQFDLVILDWGLPGITGIDLCNRYRKEGGSAPILFLTGNSEIDHKKAGFKAGADDYLTKPFEMEELLLRVDSLLKRPSNLVAETLKAGDLEVEPRSGQVTMAGAKIHLQPKELALLEFFMRHPNTIYDSDYLLSSVWETDSETTDVALRTCISNLRKKLGKQNGSTIIESVHGKGYKFNPDTF